MEKNNWLSLVFLRISHLSFAFLVVIMHLACFVWGFCILIKAIVDAGCMRSAEVAVETCLCPSWLPLSVLTSSQTSVVI